MPDLLSPDFERSSQLPSLNKLPTTDTGRYGFSGKIEITFSSVEQHKMFFLGKMIDSVEKSNGSNQTPWDIMYESVSNNDHVLAVRGLSAPEDAEYKSSNGQKSVSVIGPGYDSVTYPQGYVYEIDKKEILVMFAADSQTSSTPYEGSLKLKLPNGKDLYYRDWSVPITPDELPNFARPKSKRSVTEAVVNLTDKKPIAVFSGFNDQSWAQIAQEYGCKFIGSKPDLNYSAIKEVDEYISKIGLETGKQADEIKSEATNTFEKISEYCKGKEGKITIPTQT